MDTLEDRGTVKLWNTEEGWGVVALDAEGLEVWVHFSAIDGDATSYRKLTPGQKVTCLYEIPGQDGYPARAARIRIA